MKQYFYLVNCVGLTGNRKAVQSLIEMTQFSETTREITWETFRRNCDLDDVKERFPFYSYNREEFNAYAELTCGYHIKDDWAVGFWTGEFMGEKVYYITHSGIEYIFSKNTHPLF